MRVRYFDQNNGSARFEVHVNAQVVDQWIAEDRVPTQKIDSSSSALRVIGMIRLKTGDQIRIEGTPDGGESAALDYIEVRRR